MIRVCLRHAPPRLSRHVLARRFLAGSIPGFESEPRLPPSLRDFVSLVSTKEELFKDAQQGTTSDLCHRRCSNVCRVYRADGLSGLHFHRRCQIVIFISAQGPAPVSAKLGGLNYLFRGPKIKNFGMRKKKYQTKYNQSSNLILIPNYSDLKKKSSKYP